MISSLLRIAAICTMTLLAVAGCKPEASPPPAATANKAEPHEAPTAGDRAPTRVDDTAASENVAGSRMEGEPAPGDKPPLAAEETMPEQQPSDTELAEKATAPDAVVAANNAFALALYHQLRVEPGNLTFSPASISAALAMTFAGAKTETAEQMKRAMHLPDDADAVHGGWATLLADWQAATDIELEVANRIFGDRKVAYEQPFLELTRVRYGAPLEPVDFAGAPEAQRQHINQWVEDKTHQRIQELIPADGVTPQTRMALVNALYFKAEWRTKFESMGTREDDFTLDDATRVKAPIMSGMMPSQYAEVDGAQVAELSYVGGRFAAMFVLPPPGERMGDFEAKLDDALLARMTGSLGPQLLRMRLPRFELRPKGSVELSRVLEGLGMQRPFDAANADFTGITNPSDPRERLFIEKVFHQAFVAMDENGTEAAAATAVMMGRGAGLPPETVDFHATRPFLFFLRDTQTGMVLFVGRVMDPTT